MDCCLPGFPVLHCLPEFAQTHVRCSDNVIQPFHFLLSFILLASVFPSIKVFSNESALCIRWPKFWSFSLASVFPMKSQYWFPLALASLISLLSKGFSRVFSSTTVWKHQLFAAQPSLQSSSHIQTWLLEKKTNKHSFDSRDLCLKVMSLLFNMLSRFVMGLPCGSTVKKSACNAGIEGDVSLIPALERSPGGGHGIPLQYSCLENLMDWIAWPATVHGVVSWTESNRAEAI